MKCNHVSYRLRTKKLYLAFDDENGIGTCTQLMTIILNGTGWTLGNVDRFYEPDGTTEKVRTIKSGGKEGAYQLINKVCELFNARPVYHGVEKTVDIVGFAPYTFVDGEEQPLLADADSLIELHYSKGMSGVTRRLNTENLVTRLYVEGEYGDNGYLGIETVNPLGTNFLMNFGYFRANGLFTDEHQNYVDAYMNDLIPAKESIKNNSLLVSQLETRLMELWGTADYSIYNVTNKVDANTYDVAHFTSLGTDTAIEAGNVLVLELSDGSFVRTTATSVIGSRIVIEATVPSELTISNILVYRQLASGTIGGKESAVEAKQRSLEDLRNRVGDNIVSESDVAVNSTQYLVKRYFLTEDWTVGKQYSLSIWGTANSGNSLRGWRDNSTTPLPVMTYDNVRHCYVATFTAPDTTQPEKNVLSIYNYPNATATSATIQRVKLEYGDHPTPWSPANNTSNAELIADYEAQIQALLYGSENGAGVYELTAEAIAVARQLQGARTSLTAAKEQVELIESTFTDNMGDLLRDGYWNDGNYIVGQEQNLYNDAFEILKVMSRPVATYDIQYHNMVGIDAAPLLKPSVNSPVHIVDPSIDLNAWGYVEKATYWLDMPYKNSLQVSTKENRFSGKSFTQVLSQIAETAKDVAAKKGVFARAGLITKSGTLPADVIEGIINVEMTQLLSTTSNWHTDERGNLILVSQDGGSAMMLTGEGFMIADGKRADGSWDWRSFGSGRGFSADAINAGTLQAGIVKILGTDQFYWDADNIYIFDPTNASRQIRIGRFDGEHYGIGFTQDDGATWVSAFGFDGVNLNYQTIDVSQIVGLDGQFLTPEQAAQQYATLTNVGAINSTLQDLNNDVRQNIQFTAGGIIIQQQGASGGFSSRFTSTALEFYEGSDKIAWFENRALNVENVIAQRQMSIGNLVWYVQGDNSVAAKWYGGA